MTFIPQSRIKSLAKKADKAINFRKKIKGFAGIVLEMIDGNVFREALNLINNKLGDKVPVEYQDEILTLLEAIDTGDRTLITEATVQAFNELIDIPVLNEDEEAIAMTGIVQLILRLLLHQKE